MMYPKCCKTSNHISYIGAKLLFTILSLIVVNKTSVNSSNKLKPSSLSSSWLAKIERKKAAVVLLPSAEVATIVQRPESIIGRNKSLRNIFGIVIIIPEHDNIAKLHDCLLEHFSNCLTMQQLFQLLLYRYLTR